MMQSVVKKRKKGFTLVELVVVIAIIAILSTVGIVSYTAVISKAKDSASKQELDQLHSAMVTDALTRDLTFEFSNDEFTFETPKTDVEVEEAITAWIESVYNDIEFNLNKDPRSLEIVVELTDKKVTFNYANDGGKATKVYTLILPD